MGSVEEVSLDGERTMRDIVPVGRIPLGTAAFDDVAAIVGFFPFDHPLRCITQDGLLGADVMADAVWQVDPAAGRLSIAPSVDGLEHIEGAIDCRSRHPPRPRLRPVIELPTAVGRLRVVVDTGSDGWLAVHPDDLEAAGGGGRAGCAGSLCIRLDEWARPLHADSATGARMSPSATGSSPACRSPRSTRSMPGLGVVGTELLRHFVLTVDWPGRAIHLDPVDPVELASGAACDRHPRSWRRSDGTART